MAENNSKPNIDGLDEQLQDEESVSMLEVLEEENQLEEDANAVLGDSDDKNCTYLMGYIPRQALFSCMTCVTDENEMAGVCLACSLQCHSGHDLVELYTKRNFRCDCGNSKFTDNKCKLSEEKVSVNGFNLYNHNFKGKYCVCERPYPDPEDEIDDEMIQCIICEDWYHGRHIGTDIPDEYDEMVCSGCVKKCDFLWAYTASPKGNEDQDVDVEKESIPESQPGCSNSTKENGTKESSKTAKEDLSKPLCYLATLKLDDVKKHDGGIFFKEDFRKKLCACASCKIMYSEKNVEYLLDESDSIKAYEERGRAMHHNQYEAGMSALSSMNHTQQVEMVHGYNDMKSQLTEYLKKFAENKKVVREEDIKEFFESLAANKKKKTENVPSYFCK